MVYDIALYAALVILGIGLIHKIDGWLLRHVGTGDRSIQPLQRFTAGLKGFLGAVFSLRVFSVIKVLFVDVLLQGRILRDRKDPLVWLMHLCIVFGFLLLLLFHALGTIFGSWLAPDYISTLNPFLFLRDLFGLLLLLGLALAVVRRIVCRDRIRTEMADLLPIGILAVIVLSGFVQEGLKITSHAEFRTMVHDYYGADIKPEDLQALRTYWVEEYGLVSPAPVAAHDAAVMARGKELHENSCAICHSRPQTAFVSYGISRLIRPVAVDLDQGNVVKVLWYIHVLACCLGIAYLAFSKMFHIIITPVSLMVAEIFAKNEKPAAVATRQVIELQGCSHGGACHEGCPVRRRRLERIDEYAAFEPMFLYLGKKSPGDLGSRQVSG